MNITMKTIPHKSQNYPTVGDWRRDADVTLQINVSQEIGDKFALLVALHELIEVTLCEERGITCQQVDDFDKAFELHRKPGDDSEPGDDPAAPYKKEHFFATTIERMLAHELGIDWVKYEAAINAIS